MRKRRLWTCDIELWISVTHDHLNFLKRLYSFSSRQWTCLIPARWKENGLWVSLSFHLEWFQRDKPAEGYGYIMKEGQEKCQEQYHRRQVWAASLWTEAKSCRRGLFWSLAHVLLSVKAITNVYIAAWQGVREGSLGFRITAFGHIPALWPVTLAKPTPTKMG